MRAELQRLHLGWGDTDAGSGFAMLFRLREALLRGDDTMR